MTGTGKRDRPIRPRSQHVPGGVRMKYCCQCGGPVAQRVPAGDNRPRHVCLSCATIHYQNPRLVAGCLATWAGQVLLCRRAIEPRRGYWTLPAGFMENGETTEQAALRETLEEAGARVAIEGLYSLVSLPHIDQVYLLYRGRLLDTGFAAGEESLEVRLFEPAAIPWDELAFPTIRETLERYVEDRERGEYPLHRADIVRLPGAPGEPPRYRLTRY